MKVLVIDIDSMRPDHLGCYGYHRNTSPTIDDIAKRGVRFTNYYTSDAPCLPSRTAFATGKFGIHNGVVNHGGKHATIRNEGSKRWFRDEMSQFGFAGLFRQKGMHTALISSFPERHSAWHFASGFHETFSTGKAGDEVAHEVNELALAWVDEHAEKDDWLLYVNYWDPHTPYRTPLDYGNQFENDPIPEWLTADVLAHHRTLAGPHGAQEVDMYWNKPLPQFPNYPTEIKDMHDMERMIDGYDNGVKYMDDHLAILLDALKEKGVDEDLYIIITADHGENLGELGNYGEHGTADHYTCNIPFIVAGPDIVTGQVDEDLHYSVDLLPTLAEWFDLPFSPKWDGQSFAPALFEGESVGRDFVVLSQFAHVCQRSVRFDDWLYMRTYHDGYHLAFERDMLFNLAEDPHEQHNVAEENPEVVRQAVAMLYDWHDEMMRTNDGHSDPLWTVLEEGGPYHANGHLPMYIERLKQTGRADKVQPLMERHPNEFK